jgi:hypothetical protein
VSAPLQALKSHVGLERVAAKLALLATEARAGSVRRAATSPVRAKRQEPRHERCASLPNEALRFHVERPFVAGLRPGSALSGHRHGDAPHAIAAPPKLVPR